LRNSREISPDASLIDVMATESTEGHARPGYGIVPFPCISVDSVAMPKYCYPVSGTSIRLQQL